MQVRASGSTEIRRWQYFDQSITTAVLVHSPARLVPPPRETSGARWRRQAATAATAASTVRGTTTPSGVWRKLEASVEYAAREPGSKRTSPSTAAARSRSSAATSTCATDSAGVGGRRTGFGSSRVIGGRSR